MVSDQLILRPFAVLMSAVIYWASVVIHAHRIRKHIGKSPNLMPTNLKERLLWLGWFFVIAGWAGQPLIIEQYKNVPAFFFINFLFYPSGIFFGIALVLCGYIGTLWCYSTLGDSWRIGVNKSEKAVLIKHGPYRFVRHPIYSFQIIILVGTTFLLPTPFSFIILFIHFACIGIKALDEEAHLTVTCGTEFRDYFYQTGRFLPRLKKRTG